MGGGTSESTPSPGESEEESDLMSSEEKKEEEKEEEDTASDDDELNQYNEESATSSVSFRSDQSKDSNPYFKGQSSLRVSVENQHCVSTESDGRDGHTEELKEGKFSFKKVGDAVRLLVRRVLKNTCRCKDQNLQE